MGESADVARAVAQGVKEMQDAGGTPAIVMVATEYHGQWIEAALARYAPGVSLRVLVDPQHPFDRVTVMSEHTLS